MKEKLNLRCGLVILVVLTTAVLGVAPAGAKPGAGSAPKPGTYSGDSIAEGKSHAVFALVKKAGSKDLAEIEIAFPAKCTNTETDVTVPTELLYKVTAQVKGKTLSFKGDAVDSMQIVGVGVPSKVTLSGRFTKPAAFTATANVRAPADESLSPISCAVAPAKLKFVFSLAI